LNYPYKYDLGRFSAVGSISFDHPDPSIFTVLSAPSEVKGTAIAELAIFPPRWLVMEDTFRPPWYHCNTAAELMGLVQGEYDAKVDGSFRPGVVSLHNVMTGHGPDSTSHAKGTNEELRPVKIGNGSMAFVLESCMMLGVSEWALKHSQKLQHNYNAKTWGSLKSNFQKQEKGARAQKPYTLQKGTNGTL
jgi:homogentisate 1,2-dioxygenase